MHQKLLVAETVVTETKNLCSSLCVYMALAYLPEHEVMHARMQRRSKEHRCQLTQWFGSDKWKKINNTVEVREKERKKRKDNGLKFKRVTLWCLDNKCMKSKCEKRYNHKQTDTHTHTWIHRNYEHIFYIAKYTANYLVSPRISIAPSWFLFVFRMARTAVKFIRKQYYRLHHYHYQQQLHQQNEDGEKKSCRKFQVWKFLESWRSPHIFFVVI